MPHTRNLLRAQVQAERENTNEGREITSKYGPECFQELNLLWPVGVPDFVKSAYIVFARVLFWAISRLSRTHKKRRQRDVLTRSTLLQQGKL